MPQPQQPDFIPATASPDFIPATPAGVTADAAAPSMTEQLASGLKNFGIGALKGVGNTVSGIDNAVAKIPYVGKALTTPLIGNGTSEQARAQLQSASVPHGIAQTLGRGAEQAGEFLIPGLGEEAATGRVAEGLRPLARIGYNALTSGALNKAQGGSPITGALLGGAGGAASEGIRMAAPKLAESAIGITKADRGFEKSPGEAILNETRGVHPETIQESAQERLNDLNPQLTERARAASVKPTPPIRGFLQPPQEEIPLSGTPPKGVLLRYPEMSGSIPPAIEPNYSASLRPARGVISSAKAEATARNAPTTLSQLQPMGRQLSERISGEPIPENVTPSDLLNLRRGFNDEFGQWNPETQRGVVGTGRQAYHALTNEFHNVVPGTQELDSRISNLIPVVKRSESTSRNAPLIQRGLGRFAAHTGALTGAALGAAEGRREGGLPGMIVGGTTGLLLPELIATPEGRMIAARTMASPTGRTLIGAPAKGAALQLMRRQ